MTPKPLSSGKAMNTAAASPGCMVARRPSTAAPATDSRISRNPARVITGRALVRGLRRLPESV